jgi:hypothetical protein
MFRTLRSSTTGISSMKDLKNNNFDFRQLLDADETFLMGDETNEVVATYFADGWYPNLQENGVKVKDLKKQMLMKNY